MARPAPRSLSVIRTREITPHMRRITLGGESLRSLGPGQESAYVKLIFPAEGSQASLMRTYTIREQRQTEIDIDFVLHDNAGPASSWAANANIGEQILVGGPGPRKLINTEADWFLLVGDMSALPAIAVNLASLPANAKGYAVIEVCSEQDRQVLTHPDQLQLRWLVNPSPDPTGQLLSDKVRELPWLPGQAAVWAACEFNSMRALRKLVKQEHEVDKSRLYLSSYWKIGQSEDGHKQAKQEDARLQQA